MEDITPPESVAPVYLIPLTEKELAEREAVVLAADIQSAAERQAAAEAAVIEGQIPNA